MPLTGTMTNPDDTPEAIVPRPRLLALCGAKSNNEVTKLQLENLGVTAKHYDILYLHGAIVEESENDVVDGLVQGPFYSWIDSDGGAEAMNESIVNGVRLVMKVVHSHGPFETVYGFSNGGLIAALATNIVNDAVLKEAVQNPPLSTSISPKTILSDKEVIKRALETSGGRGSRKSLNMLSHGRSSTMSFGSTKGLSHGSGSFARRPSKFESMRDWFASFSHRGSEAGPTGDAPDRSSSLSRRGSASDAAGRTSDARASSCHRESSSSIGSGSFARSSSKFGSAKDSFASFSNRGSEAAPAGDAPDGSSSLSRRGGASNAAGRTSGESASFGCCKSDSSTGRASAGRVSFSRTESPGGVSAGRVSLDRRVSFSGGPPDESGSFTQTHRPRARSVGSMRDLFTSFSHRSRGTETAGDAADGRASLSRRGSSFNLAARIGRCEGSSTMGRRSSRSTSFAVAEPPFEKAILACAGMSALDFESITCSSIWRGDAEVGLVENVIDVRSMHLVGMKDPMMRKSEEVANLFSNAEIIYLPGGHSIGRAERTNKELLSSLKEFIVWSEEYEDMVHVVKEIYGNVLGTDEDGLAPTSDFFALGGSSLDTISLISQIESKIGIHVTQNEFCLNPRINDLSIRIMEIKALSTEFPKLVALEDSDEPNKWWPVSGSQKQMIAAWEAYKMSTVVEFTKGSINIDILQQAFKVVVQKQPTLRTTVAIAEGQEFMQKVLPPSEAETCFELKVRNAAGEEELLSIIEEESGAAFLLCAPPNVRAVVVNVSHGSNFLVLSQHPLGSDPWSLVILSKCILEAYMSQANEQISSAVHPNFIDWTVWNEKCLYEFGQEEKQLEYWKNKLDGLPFLALPLDKPRPSSLGSRGLQIPIKIGPAVINQFKDVVIDSGANLYAGLFAAYTLVLHCMGGGEDFAVGIPLANRNSEGLRDLIGHFANEVAVRANFENKMMTFNEHLQAVRQSILEAMANRDVPFHDIVAALNIPRDERRTPVFQTFFELQERKWWTLDDMCPPAEDNLKFKFRDFSSAIAKFDVHMLIRYDELGGVAGDLTISTDLFEESTGRRLAAMFHKLVENVAAGINSGASVLSYDILPEEDKEISRMANGTATDFNAPKLSILDWSCQSDSQTALVCHGGGTVSYGKLKTMVSRIHTYLAGVEHLQKHVPIGLLIRSTPQALASIFGVVSFGGSIVVVDPEKTIADRADVIFKDAQIQVVLVDNDFMDKFADLQGQGYEVISLDEALRCEPLLSFATRTVSPSSVFGYFYTSGTTGKPKGAIITHGNVLNLVNWWSGFFCLCQSDRILLFSSLSFIMSLRQVLPTLCAGAALILPSSSLNFERAIIEGSVNKLICTPSALAVLNIVNIAPNIDAIQVAGEPPRLAVMKAWKSRVEDLFIGLGPTELSAHALCGRFDGETICIGNPAANVKAYVMNPVNGCEAIIGVPGELWVAGKNVSNGYLNRPELTKKHFVEDPFDPSSTVMCYKTGDLAKRLNDGRIQFLGRADTQLKVNGFRMEASEILNALPDGMKGAHVMARNNQLILFKTPEYSATEVKKILSEKLPPYMVPQQFFTIDSFPLNKNRKIDVPKLVQDSHLDQCLLETDDHGEHEESRELLLMENTVYLIWSKSLEISANAITPSLNFFEAGGTSLSAVLVARALSAELGREISVQDVFAHQTIRSLANFLVDSGDAVHSGDPRPLLFLPGGRRDLHPILYNFLQAIGLIIMSLVVFLPVLGTVVASAQSLLWFGTVRGGILIPAILAIGCSAHLSLVLLTKFVIIGKYSEGKAKVFSFFFLKWWLMRRVMSSTRLYSWSFDDTVLSGYFLRLFGARVGQNVSLESAYLLEPDLVTIGDNSVIDFEVSFNTSEIQKGMLELRAIFVGERVKLGVRSILLGGSSVHDGSEIAPKSMVDFHSSTSKPMQYLIGSPAKIEKKASLDGGLWVPKKTLWFSVGQVLGCFAFLGIFTGCLYIGATLAQLFQRSFGTTGLILYMMSLFTYVCGLTFLLMVALLKWILMPHIKEGKLYTSSWFALRKWFLDRLFLSPAYSFSLQRSLETTSTYPLYLRFLGADIGRKVWLSYISLRTGMELLGVEDGVHTGMGTYISTENKNREGISFHRTTIGKEASCGQRTVILSGTHIGFNATIGAETCVQQNAIIHDNETAFGSPLVLFKTSKTNEQIVAESLSHVHLYTAHSGNKPESTERPENVHLPFWMYALTMNLAQFCLPLIIIGSYASVFAAFYLGFGGFGVVGIVLMIPVTFLLGSIMLMLVIKFLQLLFFGGKFASGTIEFYSVRFMCWYFLADMVYLCTQTFFVPFAGTELFCVWLRIMGSDIGKRVFFSPENGGLRELDFLIVGDGCNILTPNINSHYADHGIMQFYPVLFSSGCEINAGATLMPLTEYGTDSTIRPYTVTTKGLSCKAHTTYVGNLAIPVARLHERSAILFAGLESPYPGMLKGIEAYPSAVALLNKASSILGMDIGKICKANASPKILEDPSIAQLVVTVVNIVSGEIMRQREPMEMSRAKVLAGFSVGEFAALYFAGALSLEDTLKLIKVQCEAFSLLSVNSTLCDVRGLSSGRVKEICNRFNCSIAGIISEHDETIGSVSNNVYVCGGKLNEIKNLIHHVNELAIPDKSVAEQLEDGQRTVSAKKLRVNTAVHTKLMIPVVEKIKQVLAKTHIVMPRDYIVYSNVTGVPYKSVDDIRTFLPLQMIKPVLWHSVIQSIHFEEGCRHFIECGPTKSQSAMVKLILSNDKNNLTFFSSDKEEN